MCINDDRHHGKAKDGDGAIRDMMVARKVQVVVMMVRRSHYLTYH